MRRRRGRDLGRRRRVGRECGATISGLEGLYPREGGSAMRCVSGGWGSSSGEEVAKENGSGHLIIWVEDERWRE